MGITYKPTQLLTDVPRHYCPGCGHGIVHRLVAEVIDELGTGDKTVGVSSVGCSVFANDYFDFDMVNALHGRAPAVATGVKRARPNASVFTYQGDGDLASIGTAEVVHTAVRGEQITTIFINNAIYGMTGGQMAPTTLVGQRTATCPNGRDVAWCGSPIRVCEMLATIEGSYYIARVAVDTPAHIEQAKQAIRRAMLYQMDGKGYCLVEVLSPCPTNWGMSPVEAMDWVGREMTVHYPLGTFKDKGGGL